MAEFSLFDIPDEPSGAPPGRKLDPAAAERAKEQLETASTEGSPNRVLPEVLPDDPKTLIAMFYENKAANGRGSQRLIEHLSKVLGGATAELPADIAQEMGLLSGDADPVAEHTAALERAEASGDPKEVARAEASLNRALSVPDGRRRMPRVRELLTEMVHDKADDILRPYFKGLELRPKPDAAPRTKLDFYLQQSFLSDKVLDRFEGKPVQRNQSMDDETRDPTEDIGHINKDVGVQVILNIFSGLDMQNNDDGVIEGTAR